jgi:O-antigen ligase
VLFVAVWVRAMLALYSKRSAYFALPFLVVFTLHTATESAALVQNDLIWLMFVAVAVKLALREPLSEEAPFKGDPVRLAPSA